MQNPGYTPLLDECKNYLNLWTTTMGPIDSIQHVSPVQAKLTEISIALKW